MVQFWDLCCREGPEYAALELEDLVARNDVRNDWLAISGENFESISREDTNNVLAKFAGTVQVQEPIREYSIRFLLCGLWMLSRGDHNPISYIPVNADPATADQLQNVSALLTTFQTQLFYILAEYPCHSKSVAVLSRILDSLDSNDFGAVGTTLRSRLRIFRRECNFYTHYVFADNLDSAGSIRAASIQSATLQRWNFAVDLEARSLLSKEHYQANDFLDRIASLCRRCSIDKNCSKPNLDSSYWPTLLAATAGWFFRMALVYRSWGFSSACVLALIRGFESILQAYAIQCGDGEFSPSDGAMYIRGRKAEGAGFFVTKVEKGHFDLSHTKGIHIKTWVREAREILRLRNQSRLAHGLLDLNQEGFDDAYRSLSNLLRSVVPSGLMEEFSFAFESLRISDLTTQLELLLEQVVAHHLREVHR